MLLMQNTGHWREENGGCTLSLVEYIEQSGHLTGFADNELFYQSISPSGEASAVVLIVHGYAEHGGRYVEFMRRLARSGRHAVAFDMRGHGESEGLRGLILRASHCVRDIGVFVRHLEDWYPGLPVVLFGHSVGAAIAARYAGGADADIEGLITSAMYLKSTEPLPRHMIVLARIVDFFVPMLPVQSFDIRYLSKDPEVIAEYRADPKVYTDKVRVRTGLEIISSYRAVLRAAESITVPVLMLHGTDDRIASPGTTPEVFERIRSDRKRLEMYEGLYHELLQEPEREQVISEIISWLDSEIRPRED